VDPVVVRPARHTDFEAIRDLFDELDRFHAVAEPRIFRVPPEPLFSRVRLAELIAGETCFLAVAERDGDVVGLAEASIRGAADATDVNRPWCGVHNLIVKPGRRRAGIGKRLMQAAETWAESKGLADVRLNVFEFNEDARGFYARLGYRTVSRQLHKALDESRY
jgi:ribosomal protein S18 acetylase RimI-like enzyme